MTANMFAEQFAIHDWSPQPVTIPTVTEWVNAGGVREAHELHTAAIKAARRFVADVSKELRPQERDDLFEAIFYYSWAQRAEAVKEKKHRQEVLRFVKRYDGERSSDLVRDYIARFVGM